MSKIKLELTIPRTLSDITLGQYQEYMKVVETNKDDENAAEFLNKKALQIFCGVDLKDSYGLPLKTFMVALEQIEKCFKEETPLVRHWKIRDVNGVEQGMGFIPNLEEMSYGEYVDLDGFITDWTQMHKALAILYRRIDRKSNDYYSIAPYKGKETIEAYADVMKQTPVNIALGAVVFFYRLGMKLSEGMTSYLQNHPELSSRFNASLPNDGVGIQAWLRLHRETLLDLMRSQRFHSIKP